jgi:alpha-L-fucosidase 2
LAVFQHEHIQINEQTLWGGAPHDYAQTDRTDVLERMRQSIFAGKLDDADRLGNQFLGNPKTLMPYQPFVDLHLKFHDHDEFSDYQRNLDLANALHAVSYRIGNVHYRRNASPPFLTRSLSCV